MKIFLSYSSDARSTAETLCCTLQAAGHEVFFDQEDLPAAQGFNQRIRNAVAAADLFIFLVTPKAVSARHYTLTEIELAARKWPNPAGRVLPVMVTETPFEDLPAYLASVTVLRPKGNLAAEVELAVCDLADALAPAPSPPASPPGDAPATYRPVELRFGRGEEGAYALILDAGPADGPCALQPAALEDTLWAQAVPVAGVARLAPGAAAPVLPSFEAARDVGRALYQAAFGAPRDAQLATLLRGVDPQQGSGLRFVINTTAAPELARLPWEFLFSPAQDDFLFADRMKPVVRWIDVDSALPTLRVTPPLRLLLAVAAPADSPALAVGEELAHLDAALAELVTAGTVRIEVLPRTSLESLETALLTHRPHVLHFIGHGDFVGDEGAVLLESDGPQRSADPIPARRLAVLLRNHLASLRLVFLNSCLGSAAPRQAPFGGVAQQLLQKGLPAVIAMQFPVPDRTAVTLARHFYRYLAAGQPVDTALTSARAFLFARGFPVEWGAPTLYMRAPDGRLFDIAPTPGAPPVAAPAAAPRAPASPAPPSSTGAPPSPPAAEARRVPESPPPPNAEPPIGPPPSVGAEPSGAPRRRGGLGWAALGILVAAGVGVWLLAPRQGSVELPSQSPGSVVTAPTPQPAQPSEVARAIDLLAAPDPKPGLAFTRDLLARQAAGQVPPLNAAQQSALANSLYERGREAILSGAFDNGAEAIKLLQALAPNHPGLKLLEELAAQLHNAIGEQGAARPPGPAPLTWTYVIRRGDTLWSIAARHFGDPRQWPVIHAANAARLPNPDRLVPDQRLTLPSSGTGSITVQRGDTLWSLSARYLGDPTRWPEFHAANRAALPDPDRLKAGQRLTLPPL